MPAASAVQTAVSLGLCVTLLRAAVSLGLLGDVITRRGKHASQTKKFGGKEQLWEKAWKRLTVGSVSAAFRESSPHEVLWWGRRVDARLSAARRLSCCRNAVRCQTGRQKTNIITGAVGRVPLLRTSEQASLLD